MPSQIFTHSSIAYKSAAGPPPRQGCQFFRIFAVQYNSGMKQIFTLLLVGVCLTAWGQKGVLLEKYTSAFCGACPNGHLIAQDLAATYPGLVLVFHHSEVDAMGLPQSTEWKNAFNLPGTPLGIINRQGPSANEMALLPTQWEERILEQLQQPDYVQISLNGSYNTFSRNLSLDVTTTFDAPPPQGALRLNVMITEDSVLHAGWGYDQSNYYNEQEGHPLFGLGHPIYFYPHHHVLRDILDDTWGTAGVFPAAPEPGMPYQHHYDYPISYSWAHQRLNLVVFVSLYDAADPTQRTVLNVTQIPLFSLAPTAASSPPNAAPGLRAFPNPASGSLWVDWPAGTRQTEIWSINGKLFYREEKPAPQQPIDLSGMPPGLYLLKATTDSGISQQKVIIQ